MASSWRVLFMEFFHVSSVFSNEGHPQAELIRLLCLFVPRRLARC